MTEKGHKSIFSHLQGGRGDFDGRHFDLGYLFSAIFAASAVNGF
jgi:hypothetical protein